MPESKRYLNRLEFDRATEGLTMKPEMRLAAFCYMVEHSKYEEVARSSGLNKNAIQRKVRQIWEIHTNLPIMMPDGWVREEVILPAGEMEKVQNLSRELLAQASP